MARREANLFHVEHFHGPQSHRSARAADGARGSDRSAPLEPPRLQTSEGELRSRSGQALRPRARQKPRTPEGTAADQEGFKRLGLDRPGYSRCRGKADGSWCLMPPAFNDGALPKSFNGEQGLVGAVSRERSDAFTGSMHFVFVALATQVGFDYRQQ